MRAFARDIGVLASRISEIMAGKGGISVLQATGIAKFLKLEGNELEIFITSVTAKHSRSRSVRSAAQAKLKDLMHVDGFAEFGLEKFKAVCDWQHVAILELVHLKEFRSNPEWVAKRLGISSQSAAESIQRLMNLNCLYLDSSGKYRPVEGDTATPTDIPTSEIRKFHRQMLEKAEQSLETVPVEERDFSSISMAISQDKMQEAKQMIRHFRRKFCQAIQSADGEADRVYFINIQFFPVDQIEKGS